MLEDLLIVGTVFCMSCHVFHRCHGKIVIVIRAVIVRDQEWHHNYNGALTCASCLRLTANLLFMFTKMKEFTHNMPNCRPLRDNQLLLWKMKLQFIINLVVLQKSIVVWSFRKKLPDLLTKKSWMLKVRHMVVIIYCSANANWIIFSWTK